MKKFIYSAAAMALAFFAASCQQENLEPAVEANTVTYTVEVPGAMSTKAAVGDETTAVDKVYYQVYRATEVDDLTKEFVYEGEAAVNAGTASFDLEFVKNQNFVVLFWAQDEDLQMFDIEDLRAVELTTTGYANNENAQVFAGSDEVANCASAQGGAVRLTRPISQLNIATNKESLKFGTKEISLVSSSVTVSGLYPVYNVYTKAVSENTTTFVYGNSAVIADSVSVNGEKYAYAAMSYVGFAPAASANVDVDFTIVTSEGPVEHSVPNVPVKPNFRTNIIGNLLTEAADYNVTLDAEWEDEEYVKVLVSTASDLQAEVNAAPNGETVEIYLGGDINLGDLASLVNTKADPLSKSLTIPAEKSIILNLNGYSMSAVDETESAFALIFNYGDLTLVNKATDKVSKMTVKATIDSGWSRRSAVISTESKSTLTVGAGVEIEHLGGTSMSYGIDILTNGGNGDVNVTIDGATVKSSYRAIRQFLNSDTKANNLVINSGSTIQSTKGNKSVWMQDASAKANRGSLVVKSGAKLMTDAYLDVTPGSTEWPVSVSIAESALQGEATVIYENVPALYGVVLEDGYWVVETYLSLAAFVEAVIAAEGTYDGEGQIVKILPLSGQSDNTNGCLVPNRLQKYGNPDVYYAQYQRFAELQNVSISNVNFVFVPAALNVQDPWNTTGAQTTEENVNGELQFMNSGSVTLANCTFDMVAVSPINAPELTITGCEFNDLKAYAIKDVKASTVVINENDFNNCNGGFWFNAAPETLTATGNTFTEVGRRGAIQFSANGDYANTTFNISGNSVEDDGAFLWQLNKTLTYAQYVDILANNEFTTTYVEGSVIPVQPPVAKVGSKEYLSIDEAVADWAHNTTLTLLDNVTLNDVITLKSTEYHILDLGTYTMTAAKGKDAIFISTEGRSSASYALDIKADATNPGGITATSKAIVKTTGKSGVKDRPIIRFYNGVFNASNVISHSGSNGTNCPQFQFHGGVFNGSLSANRALIQCYGGTFNGKFYISVDSSAYALISGGKFKYLDNLYGSALNSDKFTIGSSKGNFDRGVYVDDEGYIVVGGPVITEFGDMFTAKATNASKAGSYLPYSSAATNGLYYTNAAAAIAKHGEANVVLK